MSKEFVNINSNEKNNNNNTTITMMLAMVVMMMMMIKIIIIIKQPIDGPLSTRPTRDRSPVVVLLVRGMCSGWWVHELSIYQSNWWWWWDCDVVSVAPRNFKIKKPEKGLPDCHPIKLLHYMGLDFGLAQFSGWRLLNINEKTSFPFFFSGWSRTCSYLWKSISLQKTSQAINTLLN